MERYFGTYYSPIYPIVYVQDGRGDAQQTQGGSHYTACEKGKFENVWIYVGGEEEKDESWVPFTEVFDSNYYVKTTGRNDVNSAVYRYISYYGDTSASASDTPKQNYVVKYRVKLKDNSGAINSRGYIEVSGGVNGDTGGATVTPYKRDGETYYVRIYVNIKDEYSLPEIDSVPSGGWNWYKNRKDYKNGYIYMDLSDTGYCVGDVLKITLSNVEPEIIMDPETYFYISMQVESTYKNQEASIGSLKYGEDYTVEYDNGSNSMDIYVTMSWATYPYFKIYYYGALDSGDVEVGVDTSWVSVSDGSVETVITSPSASAQITYQNWRKE
jgi:hypothetical protein